MLSPKRKPTLSRDFEPSRRPAALPSGVATSSEVSPPDATTDAQLLSELVVEDVEPGHFHIASWKGVVMVRWDNAADSAAVERLGKVSKALAAKSREARRSNIHVIADNVGLPTSAARAGFVELMKEHADRIACVAIVVGGTGFLASAMRSLLTGMRLLSPRTFNFRLHGTIDEVLKWLPAEHLAKTGEDLDTRRLARVLELWAKMAAAAPPGAPTP